MVMGQPIVLIQTWVNGKLSDETTTSQVPSNALGLGKLEGVLTHPYYSMHI